MFKKRKKKEITSVDEIEVNLKKIGNIRPGVYLTFLYALIIVIVFFLVFFLPGIRNPGELVTFTALPAGSAVYVDDLYVGSTPCEEYLSAGSHTVTIAKYGYAPEQIRVETGKRLFGSMIFPKKAAVAIQLDLESAELVLSDALSRYASWSGIDGFHYRYQPDRVLSSTISDLLFGKYGISSDSIQDFLVAALPYTDNETLLADYLRSAALSSGNGAALSPGSFLNLLASVVSFQEQHGNLPFWLAGQLDEEKAELVLDSSWYETTETEYGNQLRTVSDAGKTVSTADFQRITIRDVDFTFIPGVEYVLGDGTTAFPVNYAPKPFFIADTEVSCRQYAAFLAETPEFRPENTSALIADGLVSEDYLKDWDLHKDSNLPVRYVSSYAAEAYCRWLNGYLPEFAGEGYRVSLPNEYQWEAAASYSNLNDIVLYNEGKDGPKEVDRFDTIGLVDFAGNVWEWCDNWYASAAFVLFRRDGGMTESGFPGVERAVRGGSWAVMEDLVSISSRGSQPPEWCTPFLGFRPAVVQRDGGPM